MDVPACTVTPRPVPVSNAAPPTRDNDPAIPALDEPTDSVTPPDAWPALTPDPRPMLPLAPETPATFVATDTWPLEPAPEPPDINVTLPPETTAEAPAAMRISAAAVFAVLPAWNATDPDAADPWPDLNCADPEAPPMAAEVRIEIAPLLASLFPEDKPTAPPQPCVDAPLAIPTDPPSAVVLAPECIEIVVPTPPLAVPPAIMALAPLSLNWLPVKTETSPLFLLACADTSFTWPVLSADAPDKMLMAPLDILLEPELRLSAPPSAAMEWPAAMLILPAALVASSPVTIRIAPVDLPDPDESIAAPESLALLLSVAITTPPVPAVALDVCTVTPPECDPVSEMPLVKLVDPPPSEAELPALINTLPPDSALPTCATMLLRDAAAADEPVMISILPEF